MEMGLGGSFRQTLIDESFVVGTWPLAELVSTTARDITGNRNHGTYTGTGFTRGVTVPLPEGALGCTFDGNGYISVPDDGLSGGLNLSLAGGSIDIVFLMKTSTNDAGQRRIVAKYDGTNGYTVNLVSGGIRFFLSVGGVTIYDFTRGAVADDAWHLIHCYYDPPTQEARIFIDGVQSGATVATTNTDPAYVATTFEIAGLGSGGRYIGTLALVMVGREGNTALSASLQATRSWTAVTADVRAVAPIDVRYGISGSSLLDNVARPGVLTFALDNSASNSVGQQGAYSPGHANCRNGFEIGSPVRFSIVYGGTTYYKFRGRLKTVRPVPGQFRAQYVTVTCAGWLDVAASVVVSALEAQIDQRSDVVMKAVLDQADGRSPAAVSISTGSSTFPFAVDLADGEQDTLLTEGTRVTNSERGYWYERGDTVQGGTIVWEGRGDRQIANDNDATFSNTMHGLDVEYSLESLVNIVRVIVTPRRVDASATTVLYSLEASQQSQVIVPGQTLVLEGGYTDPSQQAVRVGGTAMVTPVANTDYGFWSASDGTGTDLSATLSVSADLGGNSFRVELTNTGSHPGYLRLNTSTAFQVRGKGIYHYRPITVERRDRDSVRRHGPRTIQIDLAYESSTPSAEAVADFVLGVLASERPIPRSISILANDTDALMTSALAREPGDKIGILETMTGIAIDDPLSDTDIGYVINEVHLTYEAAGLVRVTWTLAPSAPTGAGIFDESKFDEDLVFGY